MRVRKGLLERDLWGQIIVLFFFSSSLLLRVLARGGVIQERDLWGQINVLFFFSSSLLLRVLARGGCPEKIAALRAGELRILARGAALKKNRRELCECLCECSCECRAREFVRAL